MNSENFSVPNDVSLISIDDTIIAEIYNLTSVIHPKEKIGKEAADLIFKGKLHTKKVYSPKLAVRKSVKNYNRNKRPIKVIPTGIRLLRFLFSPIIMLTSVENIITPPVIIGYWTDG